MMNARLSMNVAICLIAATLAIAALASCQRQEATVSTSRGPLKVAKVFVEETKVQDRVESFGSISYFKKVDLSSPAEGVVDFIAYREGEAAGAKTLCVRLRNVQFEIGRDRAQSSLDTARTAEALSRAKLLEGELAMEARFSDIEKAEIQVKQKRAEIAEAERKYGDEKLLLEGGGSTPEKLRSMGLSVDSQKVELELMLKELETKRIGFRESDLRAFGRAVPKDPDDLKRAYIEINTLSLKAELDAAGSRVFAAQKELESAQAALDELSIIAPSAGVVGARYLEVGERAKAGDKLLTLMDTARVYAVFPIRENEAGKVFQGMKAEIKVDALGGRAFSGTIDLISPGADPGIGAFTVKALLDNPTGILKPGTFVRATIDAGKPLAMLRLPAGAVALKSGGKGRVYAIVGGKVAIRELAYEREEGGYCLFLPVSSSGAANPLPAGTVAIEDPDPSLADGDLVDAGPVVDAAAGGKR